MRNLNSWLFPSLLVAWLALLVNGEIIAQNSPFPQTMDITLLKLKAPISLNGKKYSEVRFINNPIPGFGFKILTLSQGSEDKCLAVVCDIQNNICKSITERIKENLDESYKIELENEKSPGWCDVSETGNFRIKATTANQFIVIKAKREMKSLITDAPQTLEDIMKKTIGLYPFEVKSKVLSNTIIPELPEDGHSILLRNFSSFYMTMILTDLKTSMNETKQSLQDIDRKIKFIDNNTIRLFPIVIGLGIIVFILLIGLFFNLYISLKAIRELKKYLSQPTKTTQSDDLGLETLHRLSDHISDSQSILIANFKNILESEYNKLWDLIKLDDREMIQRQLTKIDQSIQILVSNNEELKLLKHKSHTLQIQLDALQTELSATQQNLELTTANFNKIKEENKNEQNSRQKLLDILLSQEGIKESNPVKYLQYFSDEQEIWKAFRRIMQFQQAWFYGSDLLDILDADTHRLCGLDRLKTKLQEYAPFVLTDYPYDQPEAPVKDRLTLYLIFVFKDLIQPILRARSLLAAYCPDMDGTATALELSAAEQGLRAILASVGVRPDMIQLLKPPIYTYEIIGGRREPQSAQNNPRFQKALTHYFEEAQDSNTVLVTDVCVWGYSVEGKPEANQQSAVYVRDRA